MSRIRKIILEVLAESAKKVEFILSNPKLVNRLTQAIQRDIEVEDKSLTLEALLNSWDNDIYLDKNLNWVVHQYINGAFHYGDIDKVKEDLKKFEKYKKNRDIFNSADLNQYDYNTLKQKLNNIDDNNINQLGSSARKNAIEKGKDEIEKYYENNKWFIIIPKTEAAARYWGKRTHWCTAADSEKNMFDRYNTHGPLYILIDKNNPSKKYQFHFESNQFMDVNDDPIDIPMFLKDNPEIKSIFKNKIDKTDYLTWIWLDKNELSYETCLEAIKYDGRALKYIPEELRTPEMYLTAVKKNGYTLQYVPTEFKTEEICLEAVKESGLALKYVPKELVNPEICLAAVKQDSYALLDVPKELITPEICLAAVKRNGFVLLYIPEELITPEICLAAVKENGLVLQDVPEELRTPEICLAAVKRNGEALLDVPKELRTPEICLAAVEQDSDILEFIPEELETYIQSLMI